MSELTCLELSVVLWIVHVVFQAAYGNAELPSGYLFTSRDKPPAPSGLIFGRATRALANYVENLTPFVALALALIVTQRAGGLGATIWILARIVYIPLYLFDVVYGRTAIWAISIVGLVMMLTRLAFACEARQTTRNSDGRPRRAGLSCGHRCSEDTCFTRTSMRQRISMP